MIYPCLKINLSKVGQNCKLINDRCARQGISVVGVSKCVLADLRIAEVFKEQGIDIFGDSRLKNIKKLFLHFGPGQKLMLLRTPMLSEIDEMVNICYVSMNTQEKTVSAISQSCSKYGLTHRVIVMVETDDRREGLLPEEVPVFCNHIITRCPGIKLWGLGTNARCISKRKPTLKSTETLLRIKKDIEKKFSISIPVISGGNSSIWGLIGSGILPQGINQVRIGEAILLGHETASYKPVEGAFRDSFVLEAEVIEIKRKDDKIYKIIIALGLQDVNCNNITCVNDALDFLDQSSDHTVLEVNNGKVFEVGDIIRFRPDYFGLLACMTSPFVEKTYIKD